MRLKTIGGLWIEELAASPSLGPRQLALLAVVAAAGKKAISRERVIGILWPDTGEDQARHTLSQTLYSLRRDGGTELISGTTQLRLTIPSDIGELQEAAATGDLNAIATLYTGRFLEGFYLPAAPDFERWVEDERARLHQVALRAIERLARQSDETGDHAEALRWWQQLSDLDPLCARYAAGHMQSLANAGDRSAALVRARAYCEAVQRELDTEPDPAVLKLEQTLRSAPSLKPASSAPAPFPAQPAPAQPIVSASPAQPERHWKRWLIPAALLSLLAVALVARRLGSRADQGGLFLAVGEIRVEGSSDSARTGPILRDLLATSLGGIDGLPVVANSRLVELMPRGADTIPRAVHDAARRAGATEVIEGNLATEPGGLVLSLQRVTLQRGVVRKGYVVRATNRFAVVDSAAAAIARDLQRSPPTLAATEIRTASPAAYALYDEGLRAFYGYDAPAAYRLMRAALERDSNFAMAAFYVWQLGRSFANDSTQAEEQSRAQRLAARTTERERLLILGSIAEVDAPLRRSLAIAETLTVKYPGDPEGHLLLGNVQWYAGNWAEAVAAYQRAVELDSAAGTLHGPYCRVCSALGGMAQQYLWWDSAAAAERTARRLSALRPEASSRSNLIEPLLRQGRFQEAARIEAALDPDTSDVSHAPMLFRDAIRWGRYEEVDRRLRDNARSSIRENQGEAWWLLQLSLRDQGRLREADSVRQRSREDILARGGVPADQPDDAFMIGFERGHPEVSIRTFRHDFERTIHSKTPPGVRNRYMIWYLTLAGTVYAATGDSAVVRRLADSLEVLGQTSHFGRDAKLHYFLRGLLLQSQGRHADAVDAFRRSLFSLTDGYTRTNLMMARSLLELHRPAEAIAVLRPAIRGGVDGSNTYTSRTELHEAMAQAFEQASQSDSAKAHWRAVESAWRRADPQFHERYLRAKQKAGL